ncbi:kunitz-type U19-barytoxin-Tl1a [Drosophila sechellia]|uniref:GM17891 n=2 Tax=melanogaster subgroup TaxID=32351 RepID=B4I245_DROSE|nr:kunitz-type U19-barytoxin-Tl1a [Drosophila sechellia]XP_033164070.1 kunitz-type U19-barytoxin-Tl1a [Drosophila mauritiana]EDW54602.1 GM17891 [Drosophila sechellia]
MKLKINLAFLRATLVGLLSIILLTQTAHIEAFGGGGGSSGNGAVVSCKELNNVNCYVGRNEGNFCSRKDQTKVVTRWYFDKGVCKPFNYKGCNGNRNRFCSQESCDARCGD